jgi:site-specific DNA-methyltransferase (adenine-specific)
MRCAVSHTFVATLRAELSGNGCQIATTRKAERDGCVYTIETGRIGATQKLAPDVRATIRDTKLVDDPGELKRLARLPEEEQRRVVERLVSGRSTRVHSAHNQLKFEAWDQQEAEERRRSTAKAYLWQMDALEFLRRYAPASVDLLLTDPPYMTDVPDIAAFVRAWVPLALRTVKPTGRVYIFAGSHPDEQLAYDEVLRAVSLELGFTIYQRLGWTYDNTLGPAPKYKYKNNLQEAFYLWGPEAPPLDSPLLTEQFSVQNISAPDGRSAIRHHRWEKPKPLIAQWVRHSTRPGDLVIDPFAGSGTHLLVATELGRRAEGSEHDPEEFQKAINRGCVCAP